jgi:cytochrome c-type biogenesis protein CcmH
MAGALLAAIALLASVGGPARADTTAPDPQARGPGDTTQFQIESDLTCQCGCGLTVHSCNHLNCSSGIPLKREIAEQLAAGRSRPEILAHFETKYGEKILAAPTTRGFNLAAWTVPFIAIGVGGIAIAAILARWRRAATHGVPPQDGVANPPLDPALRARLNSALDEFERRS